MIFKVNVKPLCEKPQLQTTVASLEFIWRNAHTAARDKKPPEETALGHHEVMSDQGRGTREEKRKKKEKRRLSSEQSAQCAQTLHIYDCLKTVQRRVLLLMS